MQEVIQFLRQELYNTCLKALEEFNLRNTPVEKAEEEKLISVEEAAELFQVSIPTIFNWKKQGKISSYKVGRRVYFKKNEIINSLHKVKIGGTNG